MVSVFTVDVSGLLRRIEIFQDGLSRKRFARERGLLQRRTVHQLSRPAMLLASAPKEEQCCPHHRRHLRQTGVDQQVSNHDNNKTPEQACSAAVENDGPNVGKQGFPGNDHRRAEAIVPSAIAARSAVERDAYPNIDTAVKIRRVS